MDFPYNWIIRGKKLIWDKDKKQWKVHQGYQFFYNNKGEKIKTVKLDQVYINLVESPDEFRANYLKSLTDKN